MLLALGATLERKVRAMSSAQVPQGYQDQTGFHFGVEVAGKDAGLSPSVAMTMQNRYQADSDTKGRAA